MPLSAKVHEVVPGITADTEEALQIFEFIRLKACLKCLAGVAISIPTDSNREQGDRANKPKEIWIHDGWPPQSSESNALTGTAAEKRRLYVDGAPQVS